MDAVEGVGGVPHMCVYLLVYIHMQRMLFREVDGAVGGISIAS